MEIKNLKKIKAQKAQLQIEIQSVALKIISWKPMEIKKN
jgi:hypothetical protein